MQKLILFLAIASFFACSKSDELGPIGPANIDRVFHFSVINSNDEDMLDPSTTNHYESKDIKLFYEVDGEQIMTGNPTIYQHENEYRFRIYLNDSNTSDKSITYIQWRTGDSDTLEAVFKRTEYKVEKSTVWLNNLEIWDWRTDDEGYYRLTK